jgi:hypothetical protein
MAHQYWKYLLYGSTDHSYIHCRYIAMSKFVHMVQMVHMIFIVYEVCFLFLQMFHISMGLVFKMCTHMYTHVF